MSDDAKNTTKIVFVLMAWLSGHLSAGKAAAVLGCSDTDLPKAANNFGKEIAGNIERTLSEQEKQNQTNLKLASAV